MGFRRFWANGPLGIQPEDAGHTGVATRFSERARRHASRLSRQIGLAGLFLVLCLWATVIWTVRSEQEAAVSDAQTDGRNLTVALAMGVDRMLVHLDGTLDLLIAQILAVPADRPDRSVPLGQPDRHRRTAGTLCQRVRSGRTSAIDDAAGGRAGRSNR
jgi:hypothetical protein